MPESSLALTFDELRAEVGFYLGFPRSSALWTEEQTDAIASCIKSGLRRFYFAHEWTFLRPNASLVLREGAFEMALPEDFGNLEGQLFYAGTDTILPCPLTVCGEGMILGRRAEQPSNSGRPTLAAVRPLRGTQAERGQRFELIVWPEPDQDYTVNFRYSLLPDALTDRRPYPYGGAAHAETIREACLAAAEASVDDTAGVHQAAAQKLLADSMAYDRRLQAQHLGYNGDRSDNVETGNVPRHGWATVTVGGVQY